MSVPKRVQERIRQGLKIFSEILVKQRDRDVSEADTVTVVKDMLAAIFGYDKYSELTSEHAIRGTFCDLAVKLDGKLRFLIEVKAIGLQLSDKHTRQAIDYAANQGIDLVVLTNGIRWILYHVLFKKPIEQRVVAEFDILGANPKDDADIERLFLLCKEGFQKDVITDFRLRKDATNRFVIAALLLNSHDVQNVLRREVRRVSDVLVEREAIVQVLRDEVIKREALEGEPATEAHRRVTRACDRAIVASRSTESGASDEVERTTDDSGPLDAPES